MTESVLFVCIGNSCRSQIAEGFTNAMHAKDLKAFSAGIRPSRLDPLTVKVMEELGVSLSCHRAKTIESLSDIEFDYVVTVCDAGAKNCPYIPAKKGIFHREFPDPPKLTAGIENQTDKLIVYRKVRDEIREFVSNLKDTLSE